MPFYTKDGITYAHILFNAQLQPQPNPMAVKNWTQGDRGINAATFWTSVYALRCFPVLSKLHKVKQEWVVCASHKSTKKIRKCRHFFKRFVVCGERKGDDNPIDCTPRKCPKSTINGSVARHANLRENKKETENAGSVPLFVVCGGLKGDDKPIVCTPRKMDNGSNVFEAIKIAVGNNKAKTNLHRQPKNSTEFIRDEGVNSARHHACYWTRPSSCLMHL